MVNAGAIVTTALDRGHRSRGPARADSQDVQPVRRPRARDRRDRCSSRSASTGDRNRALAWLMRSFGMLDGDAQEIVDLYFGQCSILVTCRDLAVIGATLANDGVNPSTGHACDRCPARHEHAQRDDHVRHVRQRGRVGVQRRAAREERRGRRSARGAARPTRNRRVLTAARHPGQQRARHRRVRAALA